ncbi:hypothetical protein ONS95_008248 [Cadophora gregata]|uniref:uncharacterized protein n=1 Tax=Cadophora gregata TaxID=51156 RepID=UPI0026DA93D7|nr:uncharacterized protein ONS95_008248 [Cadophora gregata]KAK0100289.1 hypothetical protein ONS96_007571 [Cadophora gregata f. sp. sojae]KAK0126665.1 hypothetical protein ONS95_008248 [Cadophora gregata]
MSSSDPCSSDTEEDDNLLQRRYNSLHADYEKLEARVIALAQREYQITDDKIAKAFQKIRDGLDIWIDGLQEDDRKDFRANYHANLQARDRVDIFDKLGFTAGCLELFWEEKLGEQETCIYVILGMVIANFLKNIDTEWLYPLGVSNSQERFLDILMSSAPATKSQATLYRWRGETLSMIAGAPEFARRYKEDSELVFQELRNDMRVWLSPKLLVGHEESLHEMILQPVVDFHRMIHCSGKKFELRWQSGSQLSEIDGDILDIVTWRKSRHDHIKGVFCCLLPALIMKAAVDQANITFTKAVFLGYKTSSLDPARSARSSPVRQESGPTSRAAPVQRNPGTHHAPQARSSRSKDQKSEPSLTKENRSESGLFRKFWRGTRSESRSEGGPTRRGSHPNAPPSPSTRSARQDTHRHEHTRTHSQHAGSDQVPRPETETPTGTSILAPIALDVVAEPSEIIRDPEQDANLAHASGPEPGWVASSTSSASARYINHMPVEEAARLAGLAPPIDSDHGDKSHANH